MSFRERMLSGETLAGTFLKTPSYELVEVLAMSGLDFIALDGEHAPFDRARMDTCLAMGRALDFPVLVRVVDGSAPEILKALDSGAVGIICPHVASVARAEALAKVCRFGHGGRGYAGSTRSAGFATRPMQDVLDGSAETVVIAQIEEPEGVEVAEAIARVSGIDGLFVGPADLSVCYGANDMNAPVVREAMGRVGTATAAQRKAFMTFAGSADAAAELKELGVSMFFIGSEHAFMMQGAKQAAAALHALD